MPRRVQSSPIPPLTPWVPEGGTSSSTLYALGLTGDTERALGGAPSSTALGMLGMRLVNTSGGVFNNFQITFDLEQWSDRGTARVSLSYQIFSPGGGNLSTLGGWIDLGAVDSPLLQGPGPTFATGIGNTTGLAANNRYGLSSLNWQNGDELWFKPGLRSRAIISPGSHP